MDRLLLGIKKFYWGLSGGTNGLTLKKLLTGFFRYERYYLDELSAHNNLELLPSNLDKVIKQVRRKIQIKWFNQESIGDIQAYLTYRQDIPEQKVVKWLYGGHTTVMALDKGKIIGDCWLALKSFPFIDEEIAETFERLGYAYSFKAYVAPQYCGLGVFPLLISEQVEAIRLKGMKGLMGAVSTSNTISRRTGEKMGFKRIGTLHILYAGDRVCLAKLIKTQ